jgi:protein-S-isoprenylcysteine O-methyltransferase Ste14
VKTKLLVLHFTTDLISIAAMAVALFWSAGRMDWWPAWAAIAIWLVWFATIDIVLLRSSPGLLAERLFPPKTAKTWDRAVQSILRLVQLARYILAGLDLRYAWTVGFPAAAQFVGLLAVGLGITLFTWAMASNEFFSAIVRIQSERGQAVASGGPYRFVRHPGYVALILFELGISSLFGSCWSLLAGSVCALLVILRTALEDRALLKELPGYTQYARRVRFRLMPGVW